MDLNKKVVLQPDYLLERIDKEIIVYHPSSTTSIYLNETGALVWELCNGSATIADIIGLLAQVYPQNRGQIEREVPEIIEQLVAHGIATLQ